MRGQPRKNSSHQGYDSTCADAPMALNLFVAGGDYAQVDRLVVELGVNAVL
ncbi:MAG: hypothetical protein WCJ50_08245 [Actinomycetes bacterium]